MRPHVHFIYLIQGFAGPHNERYLMTPTPFRAFGNFSLMWFANVSFESRVRPRCLWSFTCFTSLLIKKSGGWSTGFRLWENIISSAGYVWSELKLIFHWKAQWLINSKSWFNSSADVMESLTIENSDVSSAKILIEDFMPFSVLLAVPRQC